MLIFFKNKVLSVFSLGEKGTWGEKGITPANTLKYVLGCIRPAASELWMCTLGSCFVSDGYPPDGLHVASSGEQLWQPYILVTINKRWNTPVVEDMCNI